jgi:hypothetical protein
MKEFCPMKKFISLSVFVTTIGLIGCQKTNNEGPAAIPSPENGQVQGQANGHNVDGSYGSEWDCTVSIGESSRRERDENNKTNVPILKGPEGFSTFLASDDYYDFTFSQRTVNGVARAVLSVIDKRVGHGRSDLIAQSYVEIEARTINLTLNTGYRTRMGATCVRK